MPGRRGRLYLQTGPRDAETCFLLTQHARLSGLCVHSQDGGLHKSHAEVMRLKALMATCPNPAGLSIHLVLHCALRTDISSPCELQHILQVEALHGVHESWHLHPGSSAGELLRSPQQAAAACRLHPCIGPFTGHWALHGSAGACMHASMACCSDEICRVVSKTHAEAQAAGAMTSHAPAALQQRHARRLFAHLIQELLQACGAHPCVGPLNHGLQRPKCVGNYSDLPACVSNTCSSRPQVRQSCHDLLTRRRSCQQVTTMSLHRAHVCTQASAGHGSTSMSRACRQTY